MKLCLSIALLIVVLRNVSAEGENVCTADDQVCVAAGVKIAKGANTVGKPPEVSFNECKDRSDQCINFMNHGECDKNPGWMIVNCPAACNACHLRDPKIRCARENLNISTEPIYKPGDMNAMFSSIYDKYNDRYGVTVVKTDPWVVEFDHFLNDDEVDALITTAAGELLLGCLVSIACGICMYCYENGWELTVSVLK